MYAFVSALYYQFCKNIKSEIDISKLKKELK